MPAWSPDRSSIAYTKVSASGLSDTIWVMNADGTSRRALTTSGGTFVYFHPQWSPDGTRIAVVQFSCSGVPPPRITVVNADGSNMVPLTAGRDANPAWSPDGSRIAYQHAGTGEIFVMNADGSGQTALGPGSYPTWSPTGTQIAFVDVDGIRVMNADGTGPTWLAAGNYPNR
jgi:Tol biopolymer transport system component